LAFATISREPGTLAYNFDKASSTWASMDARDDFALDVSPGRVVVQPMKAKLVRASIAMPSTYR
jgi:hypothetical protein